jgi:hypothetical protein
MAAFTREYVEELRRECQRKGAQIRELTAALNANAKELEAAIAARPPHLRVVEAVQSSPQSQAK